MTLRCPIGQSNNYLVCMFAARDENDLYRHLIQDHKTVRIARALASMAARQAAKQVREKPAKAPVDPALGRLEDMESGKDGWVAREDLEKMKEEVLEATARLEQVDIEG